jgi:hypothetical protein
VGIDDQLIVDFNPTIEGLAEHFFKACAGSYLHDAVLKRVDLDVATTLRASYAGDRDSRSRSRPRRAVDQRRARRAGFAILRTTASRPRLSIGRRRQRWRLRSPTTSRRATEVRTVRSAATAPVPEFLDGARRSITRNAGTPAARDTGAPTSSPTGASWDRRCRLVAALDALAEQRSAASTPISVTAGHAGRAGARRRLAVPHQPLPR